MPKKKSKRTKWIVTVLVPIVGTLGGVAVGAGFSMAQTERSIAAQQQLAGRDDMLGAIQSFDASIQAEYDVLHELQNCLDENFQTYLASCENWELRYHEARLTTSNQLVELSFFASGPVFSAADQVTSVFPEVDLWSIYNDEMDEPQLKLEGFHAVRWDFLRAVCVDLNRNSETACTYL